MSRTNTQLKFRIPPDLKPRLEKAAHANKRSINMEVIARLEQSFKLESERSRLAKEKLLRLTPDLEDPGDAIGLLDKRVAQLEIAMKALMTGTKRQRG
jgi:hypothetical protein